MKILKTLAVLAAASTTMGGIAALILLDCTITDGEDSVLREFTTWAEEFVAERKRRREKR